MNNRNLFYEAEIPYDTLAFFGLSQEMIDDLPQDVMSKFLNGKPTPVLPIRYKKDDKEVEGAARISLYRDDDGEVRLWFTPMWDNYDLSELSDSDIEKLVDGNVISVDTGRNGMAYVQYDEATKLAMVVPADLINNNICHILKYDKDFIENVKNGEIVELPKKDGTLSVGIDFHETSGVRIAQGNKLIWKEEAQKINTSQFNFGLYGCWVIDPVDNSAHYVPEDQYTEEMYNEMKRIGQQKAASVQMQGLHR